MQVGAVKVKDGLFFGDVSAACDLELIIANKVTRIINCSSTEVANRFTSSAYSIAYLSFPWMDHDTQTILDPRDLNLVQATRFIDEALENGESALVHSVRGRSRSVTLVTAYLMKKYKWTANKALQYVQSRRSDIAIKPGFHRQLMALERRLMSDGPLSATWDIHFHEDLILRNTYVNSQNHQPGRPKLLPSAAPSEMMPSRRRITWVDHESGDKMLLERGSNASGSLHLGRPNIRLTSILKPRPPHPRVQLSQQETPKQYSPSLLSTAPATAESSPSISGVLRLPSTFPNYLVRRSPSPMMKRPAAALPLRSPMQFARPPSPLVSRPGSLRSPSPLRSDRPLSASTIRPPSPARSVDRQVLAPLPTTVPFAPARRTLTTSAIRRAPSPMTNALRGSLRPQTAPVAPVWRS